MSQTSLLSQKSRTRRTEEELQRLAKPYDFKRTNQFTKEYINLFEGVYGNYARILSNSLFLRFRTPMKVRLDNLFQTSYLDYVMNLPTDSVTTVYTMHPIKGPVCLTFDSQFTFLSIDAILGGSFGNRALSREFTDVEKGVFKIVSNSFIECQAQCWQEYGRVDPAIRSVEFNPVLMQLVPDDEPLMILEFTIEANDLEYPLKMAVPYGSIENMSEVFQLSRQHEATVDQVTSESMALIENQVRDAKVEFKVILGETLLPLAKVNELAIGDVIQLNRNISVDYLDAKVENRNHFKVQPGLIKNKMSVQVVEVLEAKYEKGDER